MMVRCVLPLLVAAALQCGAGWRSSLPRPVYDERPELVDFYYKAWEIAHGRIDCIPGLPVPRYMDEAHRSDRIWVWDTCFMVFFCKYLPEEFPGVESLENFYEIMLAPDDAPLPKVIGNSACWGPEGCLEGKLLDFKIHHPDNPPIFAWAEYAHALQTGDKARLEKVYLEKRWLQRWYEMFDAFDPSAPQPHGTSEKVRIKKCADGYHWAGWPSGMDNSPRGKTGPKAECDPDLCPDNPDLLWLDALAQQGLSALCLARIAELLGRADEAAAWRAKWAEAREKLNTLYWNEKDGFYYDILESSRAQVKVATIASFWPMLAEMPTRAMADRLEEKLRDPRTFGGELPMPCLSRSDPDFMPGGGYCRGCLWLPTAYMTVKALDAYGDWSLAREMSLKTLAHMYNVYTNVEPHTIWEDYSPTEAKPGSYAKSSAFVRGDFCGWSALGPISLFIEDVIGVKSADAFADTLVCDFPKAPKGRVGVENYRFGKVVCDIVATAAEIRVKSNLPFTLVADGRRLAVASGDNVFNRREISYGGRTWLLSPGCRLDGNMLTVEIPREHWGDTQWAKTEIDLAQYAGRGFEARIRVRGEDIATPTEPWLGFKFMLRWRDCFSGAMHYPGAGAPLGSFPWRTVSLRQTGDFRGADGGGVLHLGLQGTSGSLTFDLDSLEIVDLQPIWPVTNQTLRCAYTHDVAERPVARGVMSPSGRDMTEDDFRTLASWGVTLLRYQMVRDWHGVNANRDLDEFDHWLDGRLNHFGNVVLPLARKYGISVVLDMHVTPGGRDASHETNMFHDRRCAQHFVETWRLIARRFAGEEGIWAYDLVNEPQQQSEAVPGMDGWSLQKIAAEAIRAIDTITPILFESNANDSPDAFRNLSPVALPNMIYEVHLYGPEDFTHQKIPGFASALSHWPDESRGWNRDYLRSLLAPVREFQLKHGARIYVGEFSAVAWAPGAEKYLEDCIALFEEYGWDWSYHAFREWKGWSVEHEGPDAEHLVPSADNPRKRSLLKALQCDTERPLKAVSPSDAELNGSAAMNATEASAANW